jgi:MFS family permease
MKFMRELNLRKLFLATTTLLGSGFVLVNMAIAVLLAYFISQFTISSLTQVTMMCGTILFLLASITMIVLGVFIIIGGLYSYSWGPPEGIISVGVLLGSFYLLCLGIGSALLQMSLGVVFLILSAVFFMFGTAAYTSTSPDFKLTGSIMGITGGILLATAVLNHQIFEPVFVGWDVPFTGPFMSINIIEGIVVILGPVAILANLILSRRKEESASHVFFPIVTLIYGIGMFVGSLILAFGLWDLLWKSPWLPPLYGVPNWVFGATIFWSVSLIILATGGIFLMVSSCFEFAFIVKKASVAGESQTLPYGSVRRQLHEDRNVPRR